MTQQQEESSQPTNETAPTMAEQAEPIVSAVSFGSYSAGRVRGGLILTLVGFVLFILGTRPSMFGLDRSPVIGFVQIAIFLVGLAVMCVGGYISLVGLWGDRELSLLADIGSRLVATGFVVAVFSGMADVFGFGSHLLPETIPYFGPWQAFGVQVGQFLIAVGFVFLIPFHRLRKTHTSI
jgi:hypothetical protein